MPLTEDEDNLVRKLGFDRDVVEHLRAQSIAALVEFNESAVPTATAMVVATRKGRYRKENPRKYCWTGEAKLEQIASLRKLADNNPEALELIDSWIALLEKPAEKEDLEFIENQMELEKRRLEYHDKIKEFEQYLRAEMNRIATEARSGRVQIPSFMVGQNELFDVDERVAQVRKYFEGKPLPESEPAVSGMVFRFAGWQWSGEGHDLKDYAFERGYSLTELQTYNIHVSFDDKVSAQKYMEKQGFDIPPKLTLKPFSWERLTELDAWRDWAGTETIRKAGEGRFERLWPEQQQLELKVTQALLTELSPSEKSDKFVRVRTEGTCAPNYGLGTDAILQQLETWDKLYDVHIDDATSDSVTVKFRRLPGDIRVLCAEALMFCPDLDVLHPDSYEENAVRVREFATALRQTGTITFWWD
ncbi:MAG: DUF4253 domain-containing protein [Cyanobacteria bacterium SZAS LIN-3]|nr:DUF4253 domain-containing protein [Cyanobacteria bacterium SZAS LIN-3]